MDTDKIFLTAKWENLILITYKIPPEMLDEHMPKGLETDTIDGNAFVSLVAFNFNDTKLKGMRVPCHINFPEINLRFYVKTLNKDKNNSRRGVVFIREFVPRYFIALLANKIYNEPYRAVAMSSSMSRNDKNIKVNHTINPDGISYKINVIAESKPSVPAEDSTQHFFKEHEWGFGRNMKGETLIYRVEHPVWEVYPITEFSHNFDFGAVYGKKWESLNNETPYNVTFAKGSNVKVFKGKPLFPEA